MGGGIEGISICSIEDVIANESDFIVVISSQYENEILNSLSRYHLEFFQRSDYEEFVEMVLRLYVYKVVEITGVVNIYKFIKDYWDNFYGKENAVINLLMDEKSKDIVRKRANFYKTGELAYIKTMPVNVNQYFDSEYYGYIQNDDEIFIDCGAYIGDTIDGFIEFVGNKYRKIYAFEPDRENFKTLSNHVKNKGYKNIELYEFATGSENGGMFFDERGTDGSCISETGSEKIFVKKLDDIISVSDRVSWIKMDIEGAELETIKGAENLIKKYKPKLAVCIYHKCGDMFQIPFYLHQLVPEYKFKIRQHRYHIYDMVLYAVADV